MAATTTQVYYLERTPYKREKPYFCCLPPDILGSRPVTNHKHDLVTIEARDIRGHEGDFKLDYQGFEVIRQPLKDEYTYECLHNGDVASKYREDVECLLKEKLDAAKVVVFDHEVRKRNAEFPGGRGEKSTLEQPVRGVHIDSSPAAAIERAVYICQQNKCEHLLSGRMQIVNTWRPLFSELQDWPLGLCDWQSVNVEDDLIPSDTVFLNNVAETLQVHQNEAHKWYFLGGHSTDELLLFKIFDSDEAVAGGCPHAAFQPALEGYGTSRPRESVETRAMVFFSKP